MLAALPYSHGIVFRATFARALPGDLGRPILLEDLRAWWKALPGIAERHRVDAPAYVDKRTIPGPVRGSVRTVTRHVSAGVIWNNVPSPRQLARLYAKANGACVWVRADGDVFAVWYIAGKVVERTGKAA
jgi:hypothetical protein